MEEGGRAGLNFVRTAVLRSGANGTEGTEEEVERIEHHAPGDGNPPSALEREREILAKREHASLYDQLQSQREEQQEEWQRQRAAQDLPPELDEDELAFLREQQEKQHAKAMQNKLEEETQMAAFAEAQKNRAKVRSGSGRSAQTLEDHQTFSGPSTLQSETQRSQGDGVDKETRDDSEDEELFGSRVAIGVVKGRKRKKKTKKKTKTRKDQTSTSSADNAPQSSSSAKKPKLVPY